MDFDLLRRRLIGSVRGRIQNGGLTERSLARSIGISQPHAHNVLKGVRVLSPEIADRILKVLSLSVLDLLEADELASRFRGERGEGRYGEVAVLEGRIGPHFPLPTVASAVERYPCLRERLVQTVEPRFGQLASDARMQPVLDADDLVLLDYSEFRRTHLEPEGLYLVARQGEGMIRKLRLGVRCLYLVTVEASSGPEAWEQVPLVEQHLLEVVKARVAWAVRRLELHPLPRREAGSGGAAVREPVPLDQVKALRDRARSLLAQVETARGAQGNSGAILSGHFSGSGGSAPPPDRLPELAAPLRWS
jgi:transcriptional regulator with XRE-family HTH domain